MRILFGNIIFTSPSPPRPPPLRSCPVMVELFISVYIVLSFCQFTGLLLWWLLASSMRVLFFMLYIIVIMMNINISSLHLTSWSPSKGIESWWALGPASVACPAVYSWEEGDPLRTRTEGVSFQTRLYEALSFGQELWIFSKRYSHSLTGCYLIPCARHTRDHIQSPERWSNHGI